MKNVFVTTSWDDGHVLDIRLAALLKKYNIPGTFYVAPNDCESTPEERLTNEQIKSLSASFEIGAHTMSHVPLVRLSDEEAFEQMKESKRYLADIVGREITTFCYPRGQYRSQHVRMARDAGFAYARTVKRFSFGYETSPFEARTTVNTYNHYSDLWKVACFVNFNPIKIFRNFHWETLAKTMFDRVLETGGEFHLWGHSWEIEGHGDWEKLESVLAYIAHKQNVKYVTNGELAQQKTRKVLITTPYFPPHIGGTQLYSYHIAKNLQENPRWEVCVATSGNSGMRTVEENYDGIKVYRLPYWFKISNTPMNLWWFVTLRRIIKKENVAIINVHTPVPGIGDMAALLAGKRPVIVTYHAGSMRKGRFLPDVFVWIYERILMKFLLGKASRIACSSDYVRSEFLGDYGYKSTTVTPAVDSEVFQPDFKKRPKVPTILFVAGLSRGEQYKGLGLLLRAMEKIQKDIKDIQLIVVGEGSMRKAYELSAQKKGLQNNVTFKGRLEGKTLVGAYQAATLFVLPSSNESFSMAILEGMACELPVVSTTVGGIPSLVDEGKTGFLIRPHDLEDLVKKIEMLIKDESLSSTLGKNGRTKIVRAFSWQERAKRYGEIFERALSTPKPPIVTITAYYPPHIGGIEVVAEEISRELARRHYPVKIFTSDIEAKNSPREECSPDYHLERLSSGEFAHTPFIWALPFKLLFAPRKSIFHVHIAQAIVPEVALFAAWLRRFPYVLHFHMEVGPSGPLGPIFVLYKKLFRGIVLRAADKVIVLAPEQVDFLVKQYGVDRSKIVVIPNGVAESFFNREPRAFNEDPIRLLYVGRLALQKRPERLIEAMHLLKVPAHLTLVGDGEDREKLDDLIKKYDLKNISFAGRKYGDELRKYYQNADIFLISSDLEGMPLVVLEAMAAGLPVIGSDVPGIRDLVDGVGILVKEPYPEQFAEAITNLVKNRDRLKKLSAQSIDKAEQYSWSKLIEKVETIYKEVEK